MPEYKITWEIDMDGDDPRDAAKQAFALMKNDGSSACCFDVEDSDGNKFFVDLEDETNDYANGV